MEKFKKMLMQHKCVCVEFPPIIPGNGSFFMRYHMDEHGNIRELYDYNRTVYFVCNIKDERSFNDCFYYMKDATKITPCTNNWYRHEA